MNTYVIRRRTAWGTPEELERTAGRSARVGSEEMPDQVRWIRTYVVREEDGRLGSLCIYQATGPEALRDHACRVGMPADEIGEVLRTVIVREDPE